MLERCPNGSFNCAGEGKIDNDSDHYFRCKACYKDLRQAKMKVGVIEPFYVCAYGISRHYLGPQEGGSWGDDTEVYEVRKVWSFQQALRVKRELLDKYPPPHYNRYSCANRGQADTYVQLCYSEEQFPEESRASRTYE